MRRPIHDFFSLASTTQEGWTVSVASRWPSHQRNLKDNKKGQGCAVSAVETVGLLNEKPNLKIDEAGDVKIKRRQYQGDK